MTVQPILDLLQAGVLAAGLDGIENERNPGEPLHIDMYTEGHTVAAAKRLPGSLLDVLRLLENWMFCRRLARK